MSASTPVVTCEGGPWDGLVIGTDEPFTVFADGAIISEACDSADVYVVDARRRVALWGPRPAPSSIPCHACGRNTTGRRSGIAQCLACAGAPL